MDRLRTDKARQLYDTMCDAREALRKSTAEYSRVLALAWDTEGNADGMLALRGEGKVHAEASLRYSDALMAWLAYVETILAQKEAESGKNSVEFSRQR